MKKGAIVVYESTVYPGATEEICIPLLEKHSGMKWMQDFHVGYSPERVNPGDKERAITKIVKVVSGDDEATLKTVGDLYESVITAGVHRASSIKVTFKENCPDIRNSKVADLVRELQDYGCDVLVHDPIADPEEARHEYGIALTPWETLPQADALVAAVSHRKYLDMQLPELLGKLKVGGVFIDVKSAYNPAVIRAAGPTLWRL